MAFDNNTDGCDSIVVKAPEVNFPQFSPFSQKVLGILNEVSGISKKKKKKLKYF
jgi:hypothetical protein